MDNRAIIKRALRMIGVLRSGREPTDGQATDALESLQDMANAMFATQGGPWIEQEITVDSTAEENDRIRVNSTVPITITLPISITGRERVVDTCGCVTVIQTCSNERAPKDMAKVFITDVYGSITPLLYTYRADLAEWILASALTLEGSAPWGVQHKEGVSALLAERIAPDFYQEVSAGVARMAAQGRLALTQRFDVQRTTTQTEYF